MKNHMFFSKNAKNKLIAQEAGINTAKNSYKQGLYHQSIMFSWDREPVLLEIMLENFDLTYINKPRNLDELRAIFTESCFIEYERLKANHKGPLPVEDYNDEAFIGFLFESSTTAVKFGLPADFYHSLREQKVKDLDNVWKEMFINTYSLDAVKQYALDNFEKKLWNKRITPAIQEAALYEINRFWSNVISVDEVVQTYD